MSEDANNRTKPRPIGNIVLKVENYDTSITRLRCYQGMIEGTGRRRLVERRKDRHRASENPLEPKGFQNLRLHRPIGHGALAARLLPGVFERLRRERSVHRDMGEQAGRTRLRHAPRPADSNLAQHRQARQNAPLPVERRDGLRSPGNALDRHRDHQFIRSAEKRGLRRP